MSQFRNSERLHVRSRSLSSADLTALLHAEPTVSWLHPEGFAIGFGTAAQIRTGGTERFRDARRWWRELCERSQLPADLHETPLAFGAFTFSPDSSTCSILQVPKVAVIRRGDEARLLSIRTNPNEEWPKLPRVPDHARPPARMTIQHQRPARDTWPSVVREAIGRIGRDELQKVVLAREIELQAAEPIRAGAVISSLARDYPDCWVFLVDGFIGASPEMLIRLKDGIASSRVLAGSSDPEHDEDLLSSSKNKEEHGFASSSALTSLRRFALDIEANSEPELLRLRNVTHLATNIHARIPAGVDSLEIAAAMHPTAAVGGTPTDSALRVIGDLEQSDRGRYAAPVGWIAPNGDGEWCLGIRSAQLSEDRREALLHAGGGIVAKSDPIQEAAETDAKFRPMLQALGASAT